MDLGRGGAVPQKLEVTTTLRSIAMRSAAGSRLIINYQVPALAAATGRWFARAMLRVTRRPDTLTNEPPRSAWQPDEMEYLVSARGFHIVWDEDLLTLAERLPLTVKNRRSVSYGRIAVADR